MVIECALCPFWAEDEAGILAHLHERHKVFDTYRAAAQLAREAVEKDDRIKELEGELAEKDLRIGELEKELVDRDNIMGDMADQLRENSQLKLYVFDVVWHRATGALKEYVAYARDKKQAMELVLAQHRASPLWRDYEDVNIEPQELTLPVALCFDHASE